MTSKKGDIIAQKPTAQRGHLGHSALAAVVAVPLLGMVAAFGIAPDTSTEEVIRQTVVQPLPLAASQLDRDDDMLPAHDWVRKGDTVAAVLARIGASDPSALAFLQEDATARAIFKELLPGRAIEARVDGDGILHALRWRTSDDRVIRVVRLKEGYRSYSEPAFLDRRLVYKAGVVKSSLFAATDAADVPDAVALQLTKLFATKIDFHHDLQPGDRFGVIYEAFYDGSDMVRVGRLLAADFWNVGDLHRLVYFEPVEGRGDYYTPGGKRLRGAFLRSPLEFSRVSSGFNPNRMHPILRDWRAHKGVDFAAPTGTPVIATADGVVVFRGWQSGYGNVIELKHADQYGTLYAHLSDFVSGLHAGSEVHQGDTIGYVGMTGWATGPHLHYEFRIGGVHQDPMGSAVPLAMPISAELRAKFEAASEALTAGLNAMRETASIESFE